MTKQPVPRWDIDLPDDAVRRLSPQDKGARLVASLARKVALVVAAAADLEREGLGELPANRTQLRKWKNPEARLWPWAVPGQDHPNGANGPAVTQFLAAVKTLRSRKPRGRARGALSERIASLEQQNAMLEAEATSLKRQVIELLRQLRTRGPSLNDVRR